MTFHWHWSVFVNVCQFRAREKSANVVIDNVADLFGFFSIVNDVYVWMSEWVADRKTCETPEMTIPKVNSMHATIVEGEEKTQQREEKKENLRLRCMFLFCS